MDPNSVTTLNLNANGFSWPVDIVYIINYIDIDALGILERIVKVLLLTLML